MLAIQIAGAATAAALLIIGFASFFDGRKK